MSLQQAYGREVPARVRLTEDFDASEDCLSGPGSWVDVVAPPSDVELDDVSLFVRLETEAGCRQERLYEHEFTVE